MFWGVGESFCKEQKQCGSKTSPYFDLIFFLFCLCNRNVDGFLVVIFSFGSFFLLFGSDFTERKWQHACVCACVCVYVCVGGGPYTI